MGPAVFGLVLIAVIWAFSEHLPFRGEVTVYYAFCAGGLKQGKCDTKEETSNTTTFKAMPEEQTVTYWYGDERPKQLQKCAVRDARNWSCQLETMTGPTKWQMVNGEFRETPFTQFTAPYYQVSKSYWWMLWLAEKFRTEKSKQ